MDDARFDEGVRLFNSEEFFDAHEIWEDIWQEYRGDDRTFLQSLIQIAAGFYHAQCNNPKGARSQLSKGLGKLGEYGPVHQTVDARALHTDVGAWLKRFDRDPQGEAYPRIQRRT